MSQQDGLNLAGSTRTVIEIKYKEKLPVSFLLMQSEPTFLAEVMTGKKRLEKLAVDPHRDRAQMLKVENVQQAWQQWINKLPPARREDEDVKEIRWMIEELRVSYFAQQLGTPYPISDKRILQAMEQISG